MTTPTDHDRRVAELGAQEIYNAGPGEDPAAIILAAAERIAAERVKELLEDKARLDWLEKNSECEAGGCYYIKGLAEIGEITRKNLDAARKEDTK